MISSLFAAWSFMLLMATITSGLSWAINVGNDNRRLEAMFGKWFRIFAIALPIAVTLTILTSHK